LLSYHSNSIIVLLTRSSLISKSFQKKNRVNDPPNININSSTANLDPQIVRSSAFGKLFEIDLPGINNLTPGHAYATPLVYTIPSTEQQVVITATQNNNIYVLDAKTGALIASRNLATPYSFMELLNVCGDIANSNIGITSTPVIDPETSTLYVFAKSYANGLPGSGRDNGRYFVFAVDVLTLQDRPGFPVDLEGTPADNDPRKIFQGGRHLQRAALLYTGGVVYGAFAAHW
jgi:hypothetical protein